MLLYSKQGTNLGILDVYNLS
jgi:2-polyprenyl-6-methoxyphenol hydroxylase-like FAD-dependent oxidoreductase